jgi:hypothetical protein
MTPDLRRALREFQDYTDDIQRARHLTFGDGLSRMLAGIATDTPLGALAARALPSVDFDQWYQALLAGRGVS